MDGDLKAFWLACHVAVSARHTEQLLCRAVCCLLESRGGEGTERLVAAEGSTKPVVLRPVSTGR